MTPIHQERERASGAAWRKRLGEVLEPGRVPDCHLGLRLDLPGQTEPAGVLVVAPAALLHPPVSRSRTGRCCTSW